MSKKIRILVDAHVFDHSYQGTSTYIKGLYNSLVENDLFEITLCAYNLDNLKIQFLDSRFKFVRLKSKSKLYRILFEMPALIKREKYDFAHFQYIVPLVKQCKFIVTIHDVLFLDFKNYFPISYRIKNRLLFQLSAIRSDVILTVSSYSKERIIYHFNIDRKDIHILPNAVDFAEIASPQELCKSFQMDKYILYVSRFEPRKNHEGLVKAYLELDLFKKGYFLVFVGSKKASIEKKAFRNLSKLIPDEVRSKIKFIENISHEELNSLYSMSSCFVYPSFAEGFGIPPIEAAISNTKVICSNQTSMMDFDFFKYQFDPNVQKDFNQKLSQILSDEYYPYEEIKKVIENRYNWSKISIDFSKILLNT